MESNIEFVEDSDSDQEVIEISSGDASSADDFQDSPSFSSLYNKEATNSKGQSSLAKPAKREEPIRKKTNSKPQSGYQIFLAEMRTVLENSVEDINRSAEQMWDQLDRQAQEFYHNKSKEEVRKWEQKKAARERMQMQLDKKKKKKNLPPPPKLHRAPAAIKAPLKRKIAPYQPPASQPCVLSPEKLPAKVTKRNNSFEREPILQSLMAMNDEKEAEKKPSKITCTPKIPKKTPSKEEDELIEECYLDSSDMSDDSDKAEEPPARFKTCEREKCDNMAVAGQPWGEGFCSEKCVIKDFRKNFKILLEDYNRPPGQRKYLKLT